MAPTWVWEVEFLRRVHRLSCPYVITRIELDGKEFVVPFDNRVVVDSIRLGILFEIVSKFLTLVYFTQDTVIVFSHYLSMDF